MKTEDKYQWEAGFKCPEMYPIRLGYCRFVFDDTTESRRDGGVRVEGSLFTSGNRWSSVAYSDSDERMKPLPFCLEISWFSWVENRYYAGNFELPMDTIAQLFKNGYPDRLGEQAPYESFDVGLAPGGVVVVFVSGARINRGVSCVEIGRFQAHVDINDSTSNPRVSGADPSLTRDQYVQAIMDTEPEVQQYFAKHGLREGIWDKYRERFRIRPVVEYIADGKGITDYINLTTFSGERHPYNYDWIHGINSYNTIPRPEEVLVFFSNGNDLHYAEVVFDEEEMFEAYDYMYNDNPNQDCDLVIMITPDLRILRVQLMINRGADSVKSYVFKKAKFEVGGQIEPRRKFYRVFNPDKKL